MLAPIYTKQFEKDVKLARKRGKDLQKLTTLIELILNKHLLSHKHRDHRLTGNYANRRECHIEPDWLLIYLPSKQEVVFERTGSHSDLFK